MQIKKLASALSMLSLFSGAMTAGASIAAPVHSVILDQRNVSRLESDLHAVVAATQSQFTHHETPGDQEKALQAAMAARIASSGYDALTGQAALRSFPGWQQPVTPLELAVAALLATIDAAAEQEANEAGSIGSRGTVNGGLPGGSAGSDGGGGGYVISH